MKRVVVDARMVGPIGHGIGRYVELIAQGLAEQTLNYELLYLTSHARVLPGSRTRQISAPFLSVKEWTEIPRVLKEEKADLYHSPSFASLPYCPCPWIQTIHDLNHLHFGSGLKKLYYQLLLKRFAVGSKKVLTVSKTIQKELATWLEIPASQIEVVTNPVTQTAQSLEDSGESEFPRGKYFFCLSNPKPHKNLPLLIHAYGEYQKRAGGRAWPLVLSCQWDRPPSGIIALGSLAPMQAECLTRNAGALLFPSLYEGFGRPPVEALLAGRPVIVSDIEVHREILSGITDHSVRLISPVDPLAWAKAMEDLERDPGCAPSSKTTDLLTRKYSLSAVIETMDRIYQTVLGIT